MTKHFEDTDGQTHVTQLTLTDEQLALIFNAVQLAAVSVQQHPAVSPVNRREALFMALAALDSFPVEHWASVLQTMNTATCSITSDKLETIAADEVP